MGIKPHCHVCMKELKIGQEVVTDDIMKGISHSDCSYLPFYEIADQGLFEDVVLRNQDWLKFLNRFILH